MERLQRIPAKDARERLADVIGAVHGGGGKARKSGRAFADLLVEQRRRT